MNNSLSLQGTKRVLSECSQQQTMNSVVKSRWLCYFVESRSSLKFFYFSSEKIYLSRSRKYIPAFQQHIYCMHAYHINDITLLSLVTGVTVFYCFTEDACYCLPASSATLLKMLSLSAIRPHLGIKIRPAALKSLLQAALVGNGVFNLIKVGFRDGQWSKDAKMSESSRTNR